MDIVHVYVYWVTVENIFLTVGHGKKMSKTTCSRTLSLYGSVSDQAGREFSFPFQMVQCWAFRTLGLEPSVCVVSAAEQGAPSCCATWSLWLLLLSPKTRWIFGNSAE